MHDLAREQPPSEGPPDRVDRASFGDAWTFHHRRLYVLCLRWVGGRSEDAEDALSRVAVRALEDHAARAGVISNYPGWLTRLAWNVCMDIHREQGVRRRALEQRSPDDLFEVTTGDHPEAAYLRGELGRRLELAIDALPPRLRDPSRRRFIEETPYEDIAVELGLTNETVRKRIQEARCILRERV